MISATLVTGLRAFLVASFALTAVTAVAQSPPVTLERQVDFINHGDCELGSNLRRLLDLAGSKIKVSRRVELQQNLPPWFEFGDTLRSYIYPTESSLWHQLTLLRIELETGIESGPYNVSLVFAEPPDVARPLLNRLGFDLPRDGQHRVIGDEVVEYGIFFDAHSEGSILTCYSD